MAETVAEGRKTRLPSGIWSWLAIAGVWIAGSAVVALAQPDSQRREATLAAAAAGVAMILALQLLTEDRDRRHFRSLLGGVAAASLTADATLHLLSPNGVVRLYFGTDGIEERITLPLIVVLLLPLVTRALWARRAQLPLLRRPRPMDAIVFAYATIVALPALLVGLAHHNHHLYVAQDAGLVAFLVFTYVAGRSVAAPAARAGAQEFVDVLLVVAVGQLVLYGWDPSPLYNYAEGACAAAIGAALLRPRAFRLLPVGIAATILVADVVAIHNGTNSTTAIELLGALALIGYLALRLRPLVPRWLIVGLAVVALAVFLGFTADGRTVRGQYHGPDPSNAGRTFEAQQVRTEIAKSPLSLALGRGWGATINERHAPPAWRMSLVHAGRDIAHVQELHLLVYTFLLKEGFLGLAWLLAFIAGVVVLGLRGLERAARERDPSLVLYAGLPLLALAQSLAEGSHLQASPLTGLALGLLVTCLAVPRREPA